MQLFRRGLLESHVGWQAVWLSCICIWISVYVYTTQRLAWPLARHISHITGMQSVRSESMIEYGHVHSSTVPHFGMTSADWVGPKSKCTRSGLVLNRPAVCFLAMFAGGHCPSSASLPRSRKPRRSESATPSGTSLALKEKLPVTWKRLRLRVP